MKGELMPCPFCGNKEFDVLPKKVLDTTMYTVYCGLCATHGPMKYTRQEAESAWNRRVCDMKVEWHICG